MASSLQWIEEEVQKSAPQDEHVTKAVWEFYLDLKDFTHDDSNLNVAICFRKRYYEQVITSNKIGEINVDLSRSKHCQDGGIPVVGRALFDCLIHIDGTLKACLPRKIFDPMQNFLWTVSCVTNQGSFRKKDWILQIGWVSMELVSDI